MSIRAIDCDGHVTEWHVDWAARLPTEFKDRAPQIVRDHRGSYRIVMDGVTLPNPCYEGAGRWVSGLVRSDANPQGMADPQARIPDMDREGIERAVLFGTAFVFHGNSTQDNRLAQAICHAWNDWMSREYCAPHADRLYYSAILPLADIGAAVEEAHRVVEELGAVSITLPINFQGKSLDNPYFDPLYAAVQDLDVPVAVHGTTGSHKYVQTIGAHDNWLITHALAFPFGLTHAMASIVCGGVMARFPRLRVGIFEGGCGWLPFYMDRLDEHVEKLPSLAPELDRKPSEYIKSDRFFISCEPEEQLGYVMELIGEDHVMYASDYSHWDCEFPDSVESIANRAELTDQQKRKILRDNALRLFRLPVPATA